jgi:hypothetical protein
MLCHNITSILLIINYPSKNDILTSFTGLLNSPPLGIYIILLLNIKFIFEGDDPSHSAAINKGNDIESLFYLVNKKTKPKTLVNRGKTQDFCWIFLLKTSPS